MPRPVMSGLPFFAPWLVLASALWALLPCLFPRQRRRGIVVAVSHLIGTLLITQPWAENWYWDVGWWLIFVFGQGTLVALGRLAFELSPLRARRHRGALHAPDGDAVLVRSELCAGSAPHSSRSEDMPPRPADYVSGAMPCGLSPQ
ncbi:hypothetical protein ACIQ7Q_07460 [Streptomyces sp. NPDC096176]|uniref:hypothetical protein n=1 Tax=Streptomyces sp. NPDC096176 TaxID=3366079 RepID=UPI00380C9603